MKEGVRYIIYVGGKSVDATLLLNLSMHLTGEKKKLRTGYNQVYSYLFRAPPIVRGNLSGQAPKDDNGQFSYLSAQYEGPVADGFMVLRSCNWAARPRLSLLVSPLGSQSDPRECDSEKQAVETRHERLDAICASLHSLSGGDREGMW